MPERGTIMANNTANITSTNPADGGEFYRAPLGSTLPTDAIADLDAAFKGLGFTGEDGFVVSQARSTEDKRAYGGDVVYSLQTEYGVSVQVTVYESQNAEVLKTVFGDDNVTVAGGNTTVKYNKKRLPRSVFVTDHVTDQGLLRQDLVSLTLSIPLVDWGVRKGRYNMAVNDLNVVKIAAQQAEVDLEKEVIMTVNDFNIQQSMIASAEEALDLATMAYDQTRQRFIIGKADINSLTLSLNRQQEAQKNYILALQNYWLNYYKLRRLTLFDFRSGISLSDRFDYRHFNSR